MSKALHDQPCVHFKRAQQWKSHTYKEMIMHAERLAFAMKEQGICAGDRVAIWAPTCYEWTLTDFAILANQAISVPIYPTYTDEQISHILTECDITLIVVYDDDYARRLDKIKQNGSLSEFHIWQITENGRHQGVWDAIHHASSTLKFDQINQELSAPATYVYTSGTTGKLKACIITHANIAAEINAVKHIFLFNHADRGLLWLPLSHVLGRMIQFYLFAYGCQAVYAQSIEQLPEVYQSMQPNFVCGVPRMLEKIYEKVHIAVSQKPLWQRQLFQLALSVGNTYVTCKERHRKVPFWIVCLRYVFDRMFFSKLRTMLGGKLHSIICGGAHLSQEVARFFIMADISIIEGYGLTETFAAVAVNELNDFRLGTVGKALPHMQIQLSEDNEVLLKGDMVFNGYLNYPKETKRAFTADGWFRTGDLGRWVDNDFLKITGRKKEMIITAGGKNISPTYIESKLIAHPLIAHGIVFGEGRRYLVALITLTAELNDETARTIDAHIKSVNANLASYETIKKYAILPDVFSIEKEELTPTLKLRRHIIEEKYQSIIDPLFKWEC